MILADPSPVVLLGHKNFAVRSAAVSLFSNLAEHGEWYLRTI
jgi:hypothetical protein